MLETSQNGQKNDLQPKKSKFLKILVKIWVRTKKIQKSEKNFYAQNIIEWAEK